MDQVLILEPYNHTAKKLRERSLRELEKREEVLADALSTAKTLAAQEALVSPEKRRELQAKVADTQGDVEPDPVLVKQEEVDRLYEEAKESYNRLRYEEALSKFKRLQSIQPGYRSVERYIKKTNSILERKQFDEQTRQRKEISYLFKKARGLYRDKDYKQAARSLFEILKLDPEHKKATSMLKKVAERLEVSVDDLKEEEIDPHQVYEEAKRLYRAGQFMESIGLFEKVVKAWPDHNYAPRYLERAKERAQKNKGTTTASSGAAESTPISGDVNEVYERAKQTYRAGDFSASIPMFEYVVKNDPNNRYAPRYIQRAKERASQQTSSSTSSAAAQPMTNQRLAESTPISGDVNEVYERAKRTYRAGDFSASIPMFEYVVKNDPSNRYAPRYLDRAKERASQPSVAAASPSKSSAPASSSPATPGVAAVISGDVNQVYEEAKQKYRAGDFSASIPMFEYVVKNDPNNRYAPRYLDRAKERASQPSVTAPSTNKSPAPAPDSPATLPATSVISGDVNQVYEQAKQHYRAGKFEASMPMFEYVVKNDPGNRYARYLQRAQERVAIQNNVVQANPSVPKAAVSNPATPSSNPAPTNNQAVVNQIYEQAKQAYRASDFAGSIPLFEQAIQQDPNNRFAPRYLQQAKERLSEQQQAKQEIVQTQQVMKENTAKASDLYEEAKAKYRVGDYEASIPIFEQVVQMDPGNRFAPRYLQRAKEQLQKFRLAKAKQQSLSSDEKMSRTDVQASIERPQPQAVSPSMNRPSEVLSSKTSQAPAADMQGFKHLYIQAKDKYREGDYAQAAKLFEAVLVQKPNHIYASKYLKKARQAQKGLIEPTVSRKSRKPMAAMTTPHVNEIFVKARELYRAERYMEAQAMFNNVLKMDPAHQPTQDFLQKIQQQIQGDMGSLPHVVSEENPAKQKMMHDGHVSNQDSRSSKNQ